MRNDSCRKCGSDMKIKQNCSLCKEPIKFTCKSCHFETDEQIHLNCRLLDMDYKFVEAKVA